MTKQLKIGYLNCAEALIMPLTLRSWDNIFNKQNIRLINGWLSINIAVWMTKCGLNQYIDEKLNTIHRNHICIKLKVILSLESVIPFEFASRANHLKLGDIAVEGERKCGKGVNEKE